MFKRLLLLCTLGCMGFFIAAYGQDSNPKPPDAKGLIQKITGFFRFRARADARKQRLIDSLLVQVDRAFAMPFSDSLNSMKKLDALNNAMIIELIDSLSVTQGRSYESMIRTIERLSLKIHALDSITAPDTAASRPFTREAQMNELARLMTPIIAKRADEKEDQKQKNKALAELNMVMTGARRNDTIKVSDTLSHIVSYRPEKKARILAFYENGTRTSAGNYIDIADAVAYFPFGFEGSTGLLKTVSGWNSSNVYTAYHQAGKETVMAIMDESKTNLESLLLGNESRSLLIDEIVTGNSDGVCLWFKYTSASPAMFYNFVTFVDSLGTAIRKYHPGMKLFVRVSPYIKETWYDLTLLNDRVDYFLVDFTQPAPGNGSVPAAPLAGNAGNNIASTMSLYMQGVPANKFMLCFSYKGFSWKTNRIFKNRTQLTGSLPYRDIMKSFDGMQLYDEDMSAAYIDTIDKYQNRIRIWFDDDYTLGLKYDYVLQKKLGGIAIWSLGDDDGYGALRDEMLYKFIGIASDSTNLAIAPSDPPLTFFQRLRGNLRLYMYLLNNPCVNRFDDNENMAALRKRLGKTHSQIIKEMETLTLLFGLFFFLAGIILGWLYIKKEILRGETWKWKKAVIRGLFASVALLITCIFATLFVIGTIPYFGFLQPGEHTATEKCINMPFGTLLGLVGLGILLGGLITKFLLFPLLKKEDRP